MRPAKKHAIPAVAILAFFSLATPGAAQETGPVRLRIQLEPGASYRMSNVTEMDIVQTMMGQEQTTHQSNETVTLAEVLSVDGEGVRRVRTTYESTHLIQEGPTGRREYDSTDPPSVVPRELRPFVLMVGESFTMSLSPDGSLSGVEGMEGFLPRVIEEMEIPPGPVRDQIEASLQEQFGPDAMADMMRQTMTVFPQEPIGIGDSWTGSMSLENPMPMDLETTLTLRERRDGVAYVDVTMRSVTKGTKELGPTVVTYDLSGDTFGTVDIDEATGLVLRSRMEGESSGTMTMNGAMGEISIPMTMRSVNTSELLSKS